jgi:hypothetical protein
MSAESKIVERLKRDVLSELHLMTIADWLAYWKQVPWQKPNLVALAKGETSPLAFALRRLPPKALANASAHFCPFGWLLHAVDVTEWVEYCRGRDRPWMTRVWIAAASQMRAECRLLHKAHGWADTWRELWQNQSSPDKLRYEEENFFAQLRHADETRRSELLAMPGLEARLAKARKEKDEAFLRRFRRAKQGAARASVALAEKYAVQHWLELPRGLPGLCFFSDVALHSLMEIFGLRTGDGLGTKQLRVRLGLIQAGAKRHLIEDVIADGGKLTFTGSMMTKPFRFDGRISWGTRRLWQSR